MRPVVAPTILPGVGMAVAGGPDGPREVPAVFNAMAYPGMDNTGSTDCSVAVRTMLDDWYEAGGGALYFPRGTYRINDQVPIPNDGGATPKQPYLRITGDGAWQSGQGGIPQGGTQLDMRYDGDGVAKIDTRGLGLLVMDHVTLVDGGDDAKPFLQTTNTTLHVRGNGFFGTHAADAADQDAIVLGGESTDLGGTDDAPFQGYGTIIEGNYFNRIRRGVYGRTYCNGTVIRDNTFWTQCGSDIGGDAAAIEFRSWAPGEYDAGNVITGNLIEVPNYVYAIKLTKAVHNTLAYNNFYDPVDTIQAFIRFEADALYNLVIDGFHDDSVTAVSDASSGQVNQRLTHHQGMRSRLVAPIEFAGTVAGKVDFSLGNGNADAFRVRVAGSGTDILRVDLANGRVGISTSAPARPLHVASGLGVRLNASTASTDGFELVQYNTGIWGLLNLAGMTQFTMTPKLLCQNEIELDGALNHDGSTVGFYGVAPTTRPTALTAANAGAINTGDATSDTVIGNMRTRIGELETKLKALGLLT